MLMVEYGSGDFDKRPLLKAMFRARKQVFVDLLKWDVPVLSGEFEIDQFDDEAVTYLIVAGPNGVSSEAACHSTTSTPSPPRANAVIASAPLWSTTIWGWKKTGTSPDQAPSTVHAGSNG